MYTSSPLGVALDSNLMSSGFVSMSMSTNNRSLSVEEEDKVKVFQELPEGFLKLSEMFRILKSYQ